MSSADRLDRRLQERALREGAVNGKELDQAASELPDLAEQTRSPSAEELTSLPEQLAVEKVVRDKRIEKSLNEPKLPSLPPAPIIPLDDELAD